MSPKVKLESLLLEERVVAVRPGLVRALGSMHQAAVVQQLQYWMPRATKEYNGHRYVYKTYEELGHELGLSAKQVERALKPMTFKGEPDLAPADMPVTMIPNPYNGMDNTRWWRINTECELLSDDLPDPSNHLPILSDDLPKSSDGLPNPGEQYQRVHTETTEQELTEPSAATSAVTREEAEEWEAEHDLALTRLARFVDLKLQHDLGKSEFREDDLGKADWLTAFLELSDRTDEEFEAALAGLVSPTRLKDPKWRQRIEGARSAQVFATEFNKLAEAPATTMTTGNLRRLV